MDQRSSISAARRGLDALLERFRDAEVASVTNQSGQIRSALREALHPSGGHVYTHNMDGPWTCVDLYQYRKERDVGNIKRFAIWNRTGYVYELDSAGTVEDNPIIQPDQADLESENHHGDEKRRYSNR